MVSPVAPDCELVGSPRLDPPVANPIARYTTTIARTTTVRTDPPWSKIRAAATEARATTEMAHPCQETGRTP
jgi:hypothetical protein